LHFLAEEPETKGMAVMLAEMQRLMVLIAV